MKKCIFQAMLIIGIIGALVSCSDDNETNGSNLVITENQAVIKENMEIYSQFFIDGNLVEESIDSVINFGTDSYPALFYVNQSHKVEGQDVPKGKADLDCSFFSLTRNEYVEFIKIYAVRTGVSSLSVLSPEQQAIAFQKLKAFIQEYELEIALLVYLTENNPQELSALTEIIEGTSVVKSSINNINDLMTSMLRHNLAPTALKAAIVGEGISVSDFMLMAEQKQVSLAKEITTRNTATKIVKGVIKGAVFMSKLLIAFIENAQPVVDLENTYVSYLHEDDLDPMNYIGPKVYRSPSYEFRYGTSLTPLAQAIFQIEAYYGSRHQNYAGSYISRIGMLVEKVRCSGGMHVEGSVTFDPGESRNDGTDNMIAVGNGTVNVSYGDCCCFAKTGRLSFSVDGANGYQKN